MILAGTGHRPPKLGIGYDYRSNELLSRFAHDELSQLLCHQSIEKVISGMAQGWDQALANAALCLNIPLVCAIPFVGQDYKWPLTAQDRYHSLMSKAVEVVTVTDGDHRNWKFAARDEWMVDNADAVIALYDEKETKSGTGITVSYAQKNLVPVHNVWNQWLAFKK